MPVDNRCHAIAADPQARHTRPFPAGNRGDKTGFGRRVYEPRRRVRALRGKEQERRAGAGRLAALLFLGAIVLAILPI